MPKGRGFFFFPIKDSPTNEGQRSYVALILPVDSTQNRNICPQTQCQQNLQNPYQQPDQQPYQYTPLTPVNQPATYPTNQPTRNPPRLRNFTAIAIRWTEVFNLLTAFSHICPQPTSPKANVFSIPANRGMTPNLVGHWVGEKQQSRYPKCHQQPATQPWRDSDDFSPQWFIGPPETDLVHPQMVNETPIVAMTSQNFGGRAEEDTVEPWTRILKLLPLSSPSFN